MERRSRRFRRDLSANDSRFCHRQYGTSGIRNPVANAAFGLGDRSLHLPSRRHKSDRCARAGTLARSGDARSRARCHSGLREHVRADRAVRARTRARARPSAAIGADLARTRLHRKLCHAAARRMSLASLILALVTLQRLGELLLSRHNTNGLLSRGGIEVGANHYPLVVSLHAAWLIALWAWGRDQDVNLVALSAFVLLQGA